MNFEDFDTEEKIASLRCDLDQVMRELNMRSDYVSKAEMEERIVAIEADKIRRERRAEAIKNLAPAYKLEV
jgi:hypothetical protein